MSIANQEMIRNNNRRLVLEFIINNPPVSRAELAKQLSLTKATISNIVQELLEQHFIREIGSAQTSMGRKPILLEFNKAYGFALSLEIQPQQIIALLTNLKGEVQEIKKIPFCPQDNLLQNLEQILNFYIEKILRLKIKLSEFPLVFMELSKKTKFYLRLIILSPKAVWVHICRKPFKFLSL